MSSLGVGATSNLSTIQTFIASMNSYWAAYTSAAAAGASAGNCRLVTQDGLVGIQLALTTAEQVAPLFATFGGYAAVYANQAATSIAMAKNDTQTDPTGWNNPCVDNKFALDVSTAVTLLQQAYSSLLQQQQQVLPPVGHFEQTTPPFGRAIPTPPFIFPTSTPAPAIQIPGGPIRTGIPPIVTAAPAPSGGTVPTGGTPPSAGGAPSGGTPSGIAPPAPPAGGTPSAPSTQSTATAPTAGTSSTGKDVLIGAAVVAGLAAIGAGFMWFAHRQHTQSTQTTKR
jgi:hypothetical protein